VIHIFLVVDGDWVCRVIVDDFEGFEERVFPKFFRFEMDFK
jgi:hypothetical protein